MLMLLFQRLRQIRAKFFIGNLNAFVIYYPFLKLGDGDEHGKRTEKRDN